MKPFVVTLLSALLASCVHSGVKPQSTTAAPAAPKDFGVLVMAHGGGKKWNESVEAAVKSLEPQYPIDVAFGMADPNTMQKSVQRLEEQGVRRIAVVRLFISGESFQERTEQILGIRPGAPPAPAPSADHASHDHGDHDMALWKISTQSSFALSTQGLVDAPEMGPVLADRAAALSKNAEREDVLILAHGPGDDAENQRWLAQLDARADAVRKIRPFRRVQVETLREDWPEKRREAEARIRAYAERARTEGGTAIVIPFRVQGFGPYAKVLENLEYVSDGTGLLPHPSVTDWIAHQSDALRSGPFKASTLSPAP